LTHEHANVPNALALLRPRRERPCRRRTAQQCDELAPFPLVEMHPIPSRERIGGYAIEGDQSAAIR